MQTHPECYAKLTLDMNVVVVVISALVIVAVGLQIRFRTLSHNLFVCLDSGGTWHG